VRQSVVSSCLHDLLALAVAEALAQELADSQGGDARLDLYARDTPEALHADASEASARRICERIARSLQAALLVRHAPAAAADAFCASRLAGESGRAFGTLPDGVAFDAIVARATPDSD
jgi:putative acyl-CoA dehydrogenase